MGDDVSRLWWLPEDIAEILCVSSRVAGLYREIALLRGSWHEPFVVDLRFRVPPILRTVDSTQI